MSIAYVDPVHDFAILRFDPAQLVQTPRAEIALEPGGLHVGEEIRVVGNDSMEKLQIFTGTIARVDRDPPETGVDYHDENTFYAMAGTGTRGGSSGSPVLNRSGRAVALNAAATGGTMHAFYLPLHRVARALRAVQRGEPVPRGSLCSSLGYTSFPECIRLGVATDTVKRLLAEPMEGGTFSKATPPGGMLQVKSCLPGSEASRLLRPGDVLLELNGKPCADFVLLDAALDAAVGGKVRFTVCRGGSRLELELQVCDAHSLVPREFVEMGLGIFHKVPYQTAMRHHIPLEGVYVALSGIVFGEVVKSDAIILELDGVPCRDLATFEEAVRQLPNKEYFSVSYMVPKVAKERKKTVASVKMQRHWWTFRSWALDPTTHSWATRILEAAPPAQPMEPEPEEPGGASAAILEQAPPAKRARKGRARPAAAPLLERSFCSVVFRTVQNFDLDLNVDAENSSSDVVCIHGAGVVVDAEAGLVLTDRGTVPQTLGDIEVALGEQTCSASVWFVHPTHSLVILRVDEVPKTAAGAHRFGEAAEFEDHDFEPGDACEFVGADHRGQRLALQVKVQAVRMGNFPVNYPPRWHEDNLEAILLESCPGSSGSGFLCDASGKVRGVYSTATLKDEGQVSKMGYGVPARVALPLLARLRARPLPAALPELRVPSLEVAFVSVELQNLRRLPQRSRPSAAWLARLAAAGGRALQVSRVVSKGPCDGLATEGDLVATVSGEVVTTMQDMEAKLWEATEATLGAGASEQAEQRGPVEVQLTLLRRGKEHTVKAAVQLLGCDGARRVVCWHGLLLEETPRCVREFGPVPAGVHIAQTMLGSPGEANAIEGDFVLSVDGNPTPTLNAVLALDDACQESCQGAGAARRLRVETADMVGRRFVKTLEPNPLFWPTCVMFQGASGGWSCAEHRAGPAVAGAQGSRE